MSPLPPQAHKINSSFSTHNSYTVECDDDEDYSSSNAPDSLPTFSTLSSASSRDDYYTKHMKRIQNMGAISQSSVREAKIKEQDKRR